VRVRLPGTLTVTSLATSSTPKTRCAASFAAIRFAQFETLPVNVTMPLFTWTPTSVSSTRGSHLSSRITSCWISASVFFPVLVCSMVFSSRTFGLANVTVTSRMGCNATATVAL